MKKKIRFRKSSTGEGGSSKGASSRTRSESVRSNNSWGSETPEDHRELDTTELTENHDKSQVINHSRNDITLSLNNMMLSTRPDSDPHIINPKTGSPWVKIVNSYDKQQQILQSRLKVISAAKEAHVQPTPDSFTKLVPVSRQQQSRSLMETSSPVSIITMTETDFPELQRSSPPTHHDHSRAPVQKHR
jgi:hypothetical protein